MTSSFIEEVIGDAHLRVEKDFGQGFVRLKTSEAEKRQAAQDIRSSEDVAIELLRNARDAHARNIFLATQREGNRRSIVIIDDGCGIPQDMHDLVFEPRVTSKLDTAALDRWGLHGRGMALYSIRMNALSATVIDSLPGKGTAIHVVLDMDTVSEKADQSTFPHFERANGKMCMRGPKNIVRTAAEFALEHKDIVNVYYGSFTEVASALNEYGMATCSPAARAFHSNVDDCKLVQRLAFAVDPLDFTDIATSLGLDMSARSSRRILDGEIPAAPTLMDRLRADVLIEPVDKKERKGRSKAKSAKGSSAGQVRISQEDLDEFAEDIAQAYRELAAAYFLDDDVVPRVGISGGALKVEIPLIHAD